MRNVYHTQRLFFREGGRINPKAGRRRKKKKKKKWQRPDDSRLNRSDKVMMFVADGRAFLNEKGKKEEEKRMEKRSGKQLHVGL